MCVYGSISRSWCGKNLAGSLFLWEAPFGVRLSGCPGVLAFDHLYAVLTWEALHGHWTSNSQDCVARNFFLGHDRASTKIYFCRLQIRLGQSMILGLLQLG